MQKGGVAHRLLHLFQRVVKRAKAFHRLVGESRIAPAEHLVDRQPSRHEVFQGDAAIPDARGISRLDRASHQIADLGFDLRTDDVE